MPFDNQETVDLMTFTPGREGLRKLAKLLRMQMPPTFWWDFGRVCVQENECGTIGCAIGLAITVWPEIADKIPLVSEGRAFVDRGHSIGKLFGMHHQDAHRIFHSSMAYDRRWNVTPWDVADKIEAYLASHD